MYPQNCQFKNLLLQAQAYSTKQIPTYEQHLTSKLTFFLNPTYIHFINIRIYLFFTTLRLQPRIVITRFTPASGNRTRNPKVHRETLYKRNMTALNICTYFIAIFLHKYLCNRQTSPRLVVMTVAASVASTSWMLASSLLFNDMPT